MARTRQVDRTDGPSKFTEETLLAVARDLKSGRLPMQRTQLSDDMVQGLRANIQASGLVTYHVAYRVGDERPFVAIGHGNKDMDDYITVTEARELTKTIKKLGDMGIDVQDGLYARLMRELKEQGSAWRPEKADRGKARAAAKK